LLEENTIDSWYEMVMHHTLDDGLSERFDDPKEMKNLIVFCQQILQHDIEYSTDIDFDDMLYLPLYHNTPLPQFDWVMIDEAQDTNRVRREIAKRMLSPGGRLVAVGDPNQAIYGFTGADNDAMIRIKNEFNAKVMPLSVSYRCPLNVISLAQIYVPDIQACDTAKPGTMYSVTYDDLVNVVSPGEVILSRFNKYLINMCFKFLRKGVPVKIVGRDIGTSLVNLANKWKTQDFKELRTYLAKWEDRELKRAKKNGTANSEYISDRAESLRIMIARAQELGLKTKKQMNEMIEGMFDDDAAKNKSIVILCSVHRAKGLEWDNVYLIGRNEIMGRLGKNEWQREQERNLIYVGITRAKSKYVDVTNVPRNV
jgi:superfamily I DNA/RNA helicase